MNTKPIAKNPKIAWQQNGSLPVVISAILLSLLPPGCVSQNYPPLSPPAALYREAELPPENISTGRGTEPELSPDPAAPNDPGNLELTVEQAVQLALRNNRNLQIEQLNPAITATFETIERGRYAPEMYGELAVAKEVGNEAGTTTRTTVTNRDRTTRLGLRQKLPTGTSLETAIEQNGTGPQNDSREEHARVGLSVTQSLLRGFGPMVNLVSVRQAELQTAISTFELRGVTAALLAETEIAYWNYVLAGRRLDIFEQALTVARQQLDEIKQRIEVGVLPRIEAAAAQAEMARRQQAVIDARSLMEQRRLLLLRLTSPNSAAQFDLQIKATSPAELKPEPISDLDDRLQLALKSRPDLNEARLKLRQNRLETLLTRNGLLPRLDLFIALGKSGYADSFTDSFKELDGNSYDFSGGIKLSHYLGNQQAQARDLAARTSRRQATAAIDNLKQLVELDVRLAVNEFERDRQQIGATRVTHFLQEESLKAEKERFDVGTSTALLVAQAQRDLLASAVDEVEAIINCRRALVRLYLAEGSLLERRGVRLADSP